MVKISDISDSGVIIEAGVREFLDGYKDKVYAGGLTAKLGIYCGTIEKLEEMVYPLVSRIVTEYGMSADVILKFHKGNKQYPQPADSQMQFDTLDSPISRVRIVLLVQIGKEGWDCRSLTGIILSQEGDCPKNMVLQTSCRCLRQVEKGAPETALIYLNDTNADKLNAQLQQQHRISLKEFQAGGAGSQTLKRYDRTKYLRLPKIDFYQLRERAAICSHNAILGADITNCQGGGQLSQGIANSNHLVTHSQGATAAQGNIGQILCFHLQECHIVGLVIANKHRLISLTGSHSDLNCRCSLYHMVIGHHVAIFGNDKTGSEAVVESCLTKHVIILHGTFYGHHRVHILRIDLARG